MEINLTIDEQISYIRGIINSNNRNLDEYEKAVYKGIIKKLELLKQLIYEK